jgi:phage FluMu gp28-like protein
LGALLCLEVGLRRGRAWWVAPSYKMAFVGWRLVTQLAAQIPGAEIRKQDQMVMLPGGGSVQIRSADNPQSLRGEGLDFLVMDECAFIPEAAWTEALRPALSDRLGGALFISTPKGRNWFWRMFVRGQEDGDEWTSWQFPTSTNPYIAHSEIEAARLSLPERIFRQEYLAEFIDDAGGVFRRVLDAATAQRQAGPVSGHRYAMGVDWGKHNDFTVITVMDLDDQATAEIDRFNQIDYQVQLGRLTAHYDRFQPITIVAERNSMGEPLIEQLQRQGLPVTAFNTTNATKTQIVEGLALAFERGDLRILSDQTLINELQAYEMERLPSGLVRYGAPEGMHDDMVMSLALAWTAVIFQPAVGSNPFYDF